VASKKVPPKISSMLAHLTGISCPIAGVSWQPPVDERDKARRLLVFLSDRRALYVPYNIETDLLVTQSVLEIRKRLVADLEDVKADSQIGKLLAAMAAACRKFLNETGGPRGPRPYCAGEPAFFERLGELRGFFGIHVAVLACAYGLDVDGELAAILPVRVEKEANGREGAS
jgi:hypothetical protein